MADIVVIGGGISGLASAWMLRARGHRVRVLEAAPQAGGCLRTLHMDGFLVEAGPNSTLDRGEALRALVDELGLAPHLLEANAAAKRRYIVKQGELMPLPMGPGAFLKTPLFSAAGKLRLLLEPFHGRAPQEESVAQFVRRRLGPEFLDWAIDPFVSGVYAGDPARLSARAATAKVYALEAESGSLMIGAIARMLRGRRTGPAPSGRLISFDSGMQALPNAIAEALGDAVRTNTPVRALVRDVDGRWRVRTPDGEATCERVVLATPSYAAAELLAPLDAALADALAGIAYAPVASVALGFARAQIVHPLDGFGMLIPQRMGLQTLGALFSSTLFPGRAPDGHVLLTCFIGGARNTGIVDLDDRELIRRVLQDLRTLLGIEGEPAYSNVALWRRAIPQYELGHLERLARIDNALTRWPGLDLRANWRDGISVADCVNSARMLADAIGAA